jgi:hypothetical protein
MNGINVGQLVEPDRVHRRVYTDQEIFDREMTHIFERVWVYCGHQSQVPHPGDYYAFAIIATMFMVRGKTENHVLTAVRIAVLCATRGQRRQRARVLVSRGASTRRQAAQCPLGRL